MTRKLFARIFWVPSSTKRIITMKIQTLDSVQNIYYLPHCQNHTTYHRNTLFVQKISAYFTSAIIMQTPMNLSDIIKHYIVLNLIVIHITDGKKHGRYLTSHRKEQKCCSRNSIYQTNLCAKYLPNISTNKIHIVKHKIPRPPFAKRRTCFITCDTIGKPDGFLGKTCGSSVSPSIALYRLC